jgi:hypothetical protein
MADHCTLLRKLIKAAANGVDIDEVSELAGHAATALDDAGFEDEGDEVRDVVDGYEADTAPSVASKLRTVLNSIVANDDDEDEIDDTEEDE